MSRSPAAHVVAHPLLNRSIMMAGASGMQRKDRIMAWLRTSPPRQLAGHPVAAVVDKAETSVPSIIVQIPDRPTAYATVCLLSQR